MKRRHKPYDAHRKPCYCYHGNGIAKAAGIALIILGLALLFMCVPGWAWAAAAGAALIAAGYLLLCLHQYGR